MVVASSPLWGPSSCILSTTGDLRIFWNRMYQFYNMISSNYGGRIQPALGTEFVYPIYYYLLIIFWNRMYPFYNILSPFKWLQRIPGSKYQILNKLTQIMGVASSPLWGPRSCILSTTVFMLGLESDVPILQYAQFFQMDTFNSS